jgi:hypothetical protein
MRHELAVAAAAGRYLAAGYRWASDVRRDTALAHRGDGLATDGLSVDLVEVELTTKPLSRYRSIFDDHVRRLTAGDISSVVYLCTADVAHSLAREADRLIFRGQRSRVRVLAVFDSSGRLIDPLPLRLDVSEVR